jgi:alpha-amylase
MRRWTSAALLVVLVAAATACSGDADDDDDENQPAAATVGGPDGVLANLWAWSWDSVAQECADVLGPGGYSGVQVAPPQDSLSRTETGAGSDHLHPWWEIYQPAGYELTSRFGDEAEFAAMVDACREAGVRVYVDAVVNHMTGQGSTSYGGASFGKYEYDGLYGPDDFHASPDDCPVPADGANLAGQINDYADVAEVFGCELVGLSDLDTGSEEVRQTIADHLNRLLGLGVSGFRIDAAKHVGPTDLTAIADRLDDTVDGEPPVLMYEVLAGSPGEAAAPAYVDLPGRAHGRVLGFGFAGHVEIAFESSLGTLETITTNPDVLGSEMEVSLVANHDSERTGSTLTHSDDAWALANAFVLAFGYGAPQVYSSYAWTFPDDPPPSSDDGHVTPTDCDGEDWVCVHRDPAVLAMVGFHTATDGQPVEGLAVDGQVVSFARGGAGFAAFNDEETERTLTVATGLPAGDYDDLVGGETVTVGDDGAAEITLPAYGALALLTEG